MFKIFLILASLAVCLAAPQQYRQDSRRTLQRGSGRFSGGFLTSNRVGDSDERFSGFRSDERFSSPGSFEFNQGGSRAGGGGGFRSSGEFLHSSDERRGFGGGIDLEGGFVSGRGQGGGQYRSSEIFDGSLRSGPFVVGAPVVAILRDERQDPVGGSYSFIFESEDGILRQESGSPHGPGGAVVQEGSYSYTHPDGTLASFNFRADENGFQVDSPLIPTPHPLPAHAVEQIEKAERERAAGIIHDGQYREEDHFGGGRFLQEAQPHTSIRDDFDDFRQGGSFQPRFGGDVRSSRFGSQRGGFQTISDSEEYPGS